MNTTPPPPGSLATTELHRALADSELLDRLFPPHQCNPDTGAEFVATGFTPAMRRRAL